MTKIVLLYKSRSDEDTYYSEKINGGIEKFARNLGSVIDDIIPVVVSPEQRRQRQTRTIIESALSTHNPDVVITNDIDNLYTKFVTDLGYPTIAVIHEPLVGDIRYVELGKRLIDIHQSGGHVYYVSKAQYQYHSAMCLRLNTVPLPTPTGFVPSAYVEGNIQYAGEIEYHAGTIGRTDPSKSPFRLHKKLEGSGYKSVVVTDLPKNNKPGGSTEKYRDSNMHWEAPQYTFRDMDRKFTLDILSHMGCFVSTMPQESWGITAMEALATGIPLILFTDKSDVHASEDIAVSKDHYIKLRTNCSKSELYEAIDKMQKIQNRNEIAELTREKHNKENWKMIIEKMINKRLEDKNMKIQDNLENFFI